MQSFEEQINLLIKHKLVYLRSISYRIVNNYDDADDAVQAALVKAWNKQHSFRGEVPLSGWVARIVITESYDVLRKRMRENRKIAVIEPSESNSESDNLRKLDKIVAELPELYREAVHIGIYSRLDGESAARELGCSANTLYQRIHKAKQLIKAEFEKYEDL